MMLFSGVHMLAMCWAGIFAAVVLHAMVNRSESLRHPALLRGLMSLMAVISIPGAMSI